MTPPLGSAADPSAAGPPPDAALPHWDRQRLEAPPAWRTLHAEGALRAILMAGEPLAGRPTQVFAWLGVPPGASAAQPVPAVVLLHGGGGRAFRSWVETWVARGYGHRHRPQRR